MAKINSLRWYVIVVLLLLATTINYIDRTSLAVAAPTLKEELNINAQQFSYIIICFQLTYLIMQPISGRVIDWLRMKKGFSLAVIWWSLANMLHALARTPLSFGICRSLLGVGEAANFPGLAKTVSEWFPPKERTVATGIANMGAGTGAMVATPLVAWIILMWGWPQAFVITGALGFLWLIFWLLFYYPPEKHPLITPEELALVQKNHNDFNIQQEPADKGVWKIVLTQKNFWGLAINRFFSEPSWQFFSYWIPLYLATQRGLDIKQIGMFAWIPFLASMLGSLVGGFISPFFHRLGFSILTSRKLAVTASACIMPVTLFVAAAPSAGWAISWFCCAAFSHSAVSATLLTLPADLFPKHTVATANGLSGTCAHLGGMLSTFAVGWIVMHIGYAPVFTLIAFLELFGSVFLWLFLKTKP
jgi:ACS family hexuronate transporter-like MFS transporter